MEANVFARMTKNNKSARNEKHEMVFKIEKSARRKISFCIPETHHTETGKFNKVN
jgi:hypothetical protein